MVHALVSEYLTSIQTSLSARLSKAGWPQQKIADLLGTNQTAISRLLKLHAEGDLDQQAEAIARSWAPELLSMAGEGGFIGIELSLTVATSVGAHLEANASVQISVEDIGNPSALLDQLDKARNRLDLRRVKAHIPTIGINIAAAIENPTSRNDIAAFPGRLAMIDGSLMARAEPNWGVSRHLANLLLALSRVGNPFRSVANISPPLLQGAKQRVADQARRASNLVRSRLQEAGFRCTLAPGGRPAENAFDSDVLIDGGSFGWEPSLYVLGGDPLHLVKRIHSVVDSLTAQI